jgi:hypothetical protein
LQLLSAKACRKTSEKVAVCVLWIVGLKAIALSPSREVAVSPPKAVACSLNFEGEVSAGQNFSHPGPGRLDFLLESIPSGWIIRVLPRDLPRSAYDFAGLATPPYRSPNPLLISTDFAFRAQDAIGWNPRRFQYFTSVEQVRAAAADYSHLQASGDAVTPEQSKAMAHLIALSAAASPATFTILDAHLVGGTADQFSMAAAVASHFNTTAHLVEQPRDAHGSPLGRITWMRFRVEFPYVQTGKQGACTKAL